MSERRRAAGADHQGTGFEGTEQKDLSEMGAGGTMTGEKKRFRFDPAGPVTGLFFLSLAGLFLADGLTDGGVLPVTTMVPVVLIGLGLVGTVRVLTRSRRRHLR
ncbi:hypothetical protein [Actinomadura sp. WMMA1423]|uniref:hypothetical protein n=1 Tax=Actinomadura sp. WMMA1423 TaxID=2591108 RepID=UPI0011478F3F|nr:hypothetical protein [Actinomadura sp. WMMA1423]